MNYWLVKQEPEKYSFYDLMKDKTTSWDGVRNYQARNNLREMKKGDLVFFYHSVKQKEVVGLCEVIKEHYQDPTTEDERWLTVDLKAKKTLSQPVSLEQIKADERLQNIALIKQSRLSVLPLRREEFDIILEMSE